MASIGVVLWWVGIIPSRQEVWYSTQLTCSLISKCSSTWWCQMMQWERHSLCRPLWLQVLQLLYHTNLCQAVLSRLALSRGSGVIHHVPTCPCYRVNDPSSHDAHLLQKLPQALKSGMNWSIERPVDRYQHGCTVECTSYNSEGGYWTLLPLPPILTPGDTDLILQIISNVKSSQSIKRVRYKAFLTRWLHACMLTHILLPHFLYIVYFFAGSYIAYDFYSWCIHRYTLLYLYWNTVAVGLLGNIAKYMKVDGNNEWSLSSGCGYSY